MGLYDSFMKKISKELEEFEETILAGSIVDAMDRAYEIVVKRELVSFFESNQEKVEHWLTSSIANTPFPLDWIYAVWLNYDTSISDQFYEFVDYLADNIPPTSVFSSTKS